MELKLSLLIGVIIFAGISSCYGDGETLVLIDNLAIKETHSIFFKSLQGGLNAGLWD